MTKSTGVGRGGKRKGAGFKSPDGVTITQQLNIGVDDATYETILQYGNGNLSLGVREMARALNNTAPRKQTPAPEMKSIAKPVEPSAPAQPRQNPFLPKRKSS